MVLYAIKIYDLLYNTARRVALKGKIKRPISMEYSTDWKKGKCYLFHLLSYCLICFKYATLCNLIKLVNYLR